MRRNIAQISVAGGGRLLLEGGDRLCQGDVGAHCESLRVGNSAQLWHVLYVDPGVEFAIEVAIDTLGRVSRRQLVDCGADRGDRGEKLIESRHFVPIGGWDFHRLDFDFFKGRVFLAGTGTGFSSF